MTRTDLGYWAARQPEAEAAVFVDPDATRPVERVTYGQLDAAANRDGDLILSGGVNIYPREAGNVLFEHPAVSDAAVVGVSDVDLGQRAVAVVVPAAGVEPDPALAESLLAHCGAHLARFKCPRELRFWSNLPRSEAGKVVKRDLRRVLEAAEMK